MLFDNMFIKLIYKLFISKSNKLIIIIMFEINISVFFDKYIWKLIIFILILKYRFTCKCKD